MVSCLSACGFPIRLFHFHMLPSDILVGFSRGAKFCVVIRVNRDCQNESLQDREACGDHIKTFHSFSARERTHAPWHHEKGGLAITKPPFLKAFKVNRVLVYTEGTLHHGTLCCTREQCSSCNLLCSTNGHGAWQNSAVFIFPVLPLHNHCVLSCNSCCTLCYVAAKHQI